jgi:hypothetical protein
MKSFPLLLTAAGVMAVALGACAAKSQPALTPICFPPVTFGPVILYPEDHARAVAVDVGEILYAESPGVQGTLYLKGERGIVAKPQGVAPRPYPRPHATPREGLGPIEYATFGKLKPATRYEVKFKPPPITEPQLCGGRLVFQQTSFTTK